MPLNGRMDKKKTKCVEYIGIRVLLSDKKQWHLEFYIKWMEIENTILSEITPIQKDEYGMYSLISGL